MVFDYFNFIELKDICALESNSVFWASWGALSYGATDWIEFLLEEIWLIRNYNFNFRVSLNPPRGLSLFPGSR